MKSKTIMMNKYGLTVGAAYTEQCTLLEPNNFIPSWEAGDEEKKEVSNALKGLRERFDRIHRQVMEKAAALQQLEVSDQSRPLELQGCRKKKSMAHSSCFKTLLQRLTSTNSCVSLVNRKM